MIVIEYENRKVIELYWDDLSSLSKERLLELLGNNGNFDVFPIGKVTITEEESCQQQTTRP